jgi:hypothetical protein
MHVTGEKNGRDWKRGWNPWLIYVLEQKHAFGREEKRAGQEEAPETLTDLHYGTKACIWRGRKTGRTRRSSGTSS